MVRITVFLMILWAALQPLKANNEPVPYWTERTDGLKAIHFLAGFPILDPQEIKALVDDIRNLTGADVLLTQDEKLGTTLSFKDTDKIHTEVFNILNNRLGIRFRLIPKPKNSAARGSPPRAVLYL